MPIPAHVFVLLFGKVIDEPPGGFPTLGYSSVVKKVFELHKDSGIYPKSASSDLAEYFYWSQKSRWAFKRLLLKWNEKRFKDKIGNETDLMGDDIDESMEDILKLWDWKSRKHYIFRRDDLRGCIKYKLDNNVHPTNPYTNLRFTPGQIERIHRFLNETDNGSNVYLKYNGIMLWNTYEIMHARGYNNIQSLGSYEDASVAEAVLFRELVYSSFTTTKENLRKELLNVLYKLLLVENSNIAYVPARKMDLRLFNMYIIYGFNGALQWYYDWVRTNREHHYRLAPTSFEQVKMRFFN